MKPYSGLMLCASVLQIAFIMVFSTAAAGPFNLGIIAVALSELVFYIILDVACFAYLRHRLGAFGFGGMIASAVRSFALGAAGAFAGWLVMQGCTIVAPMNGSIVNALISIVAGGLTALIVTFGIALKLHLEEANFVANIANKIARKLRR